MKAKTLILCLFAGVITQSCFDKCRKVSCSDNGYCYDGACICDKWYSGEQCDLMFNRHYSGLYQSNADLMARNGHDTIRFNAHELVPNVVVSANGLMLEFVTDSTLIIPKQYFLIDSVEFSIEGSGKFGLDYYDFEYGFAGEYDPKDSRTTVYTFTGERIYE